MKPRKNRRTSAEVASLAGKTLRDRNATSEEKSLAGSAKSAKEVVLTLPPLA